MKRPKSNVTFIEKVFDELIIKSWWVIAIMAVGLVFTNHVMSKRSKLAFGLEQKKYALENHQQIELARLDDLQLRIQSQSDPAWVELILKKELGVVPEGFIKVNFVEE